MKNTFGLLFGLLLGLLLFACQKFDLSEFEKLTTYQRILGGNGWEIALDMVELDQGYLFAGTSGAKADINDAFLTLLDKERGFTTKKITEGNKNQNFSENFWKIIKLESSSDTTLIAIGDKAERNIIVGFYNNELEPIDTLLNVFENAREEKTAGYGLVKIIDRQILIGGVINGKIGGLRMYEGLNKLIVQDFFESQHQGQINDLMHFENNQYFAVGEVWNLDSTKSIYFTEIAISEDEINLVNEKVFETPVGWKSSAATALVKFEEEIIITGEFFNADTFRNSFAMRLDKKGELQEQQTYDFNINNSANDLVLTKDNNIVITGFSVEIRPDGDLLLLKINPISLEPIWLRMFDNGTNSFDNGWSIIETKEGYLLAGGQTSSFDFTENFAYIIKTDAEGNIEEGQ